MTRSEAVARVAANTGLSRRDAGAAVDKLLEEIRAALASGHEVRLPKLGSLSIQPRPLSPSRH